MTSTADIERRVTDLPNVVQIEGGVLFGGHYMHVTLTNGDVVSVVRHGGSYGNQNGEGLFEIWVLDSKQDPEGWLTAEEVIAKVRAYAEAAGLPRHVLDAPHQLRYPGGKDGMWVIACSCGYVTSPSSTPQQAQRPADQHLAAFEKREREIAAKKHAEDDGPSYAAEQQD